MTPALQTEGLCRNFGALQVTQNVTLSLPPGGRHALIGPNGAGKTTLINLLTGMLKPSRGRILLHGEDITGLSPEVRVWRGLARTFQVNTLFPNLTPLESLTMCICQRRGEGARLDRNVTHFSAAMDEAYELLGQMKLQQDYRRPTRELPYGKQRLLEIAVALAMRPKVLLLDEPAAGVPRTESDEVLEAVTALPEDVSVLFIEHDMELVFRFAQRITVLVAGAVFFEGSPAEVADNPDVRAVYLGEGNG